MIRTYHPWTLMLLTVFALFSIPVEAAPIDGAVQLVDIGGRHLALRCSGKGEPTVILEAGLTASSLSWHLVQPGIAEFTRVCSYDRANIGRSDPAQGPRTAQDAADDLAALLSAAHIPGPYILVGASFGGHIVRLFAAQHPGEIAGIVLVDASHEDQEARMARVLSPSQLSALDLGASRNIEQMDLTASDNEVKAIGALPIASLVVISAARDKPVPPGFPAKMLNRVWRDLQHDLTKLSSNSVQLFARKSEHDIAVDEPDIVVKGVKLVYDAFLSGKPLPRSGA
jgi:pimeloyl-ACP methyl ester carboxylesterase